MKDKKEKYSEAVNFMAKAGCFLVIFITFCFFVAVMSLTLSKLIQNS